MRTDRLQVWYRDRHVGTLALTKEKKVAFSYTDEWLETGFPISPFSLPLKKQVFVPEKAYFQGLFGVFADSLPDAWGRLLLERLIKKKGMNLEEMTVLDRLAIVGNAGMGALIYKPEIMMQKHFQMRDLDYYADQCRKILHTEYSEELDGLYQLGGTSGGARPKIMTKIDGEDWIIKFPAHVDRDDIGIMEYDYALCAKACGIEMCEVRLFPSKKNQGYFGTRRFDRIKEEGMEQRIHMMTVASLLELDYEQPCMDYNSLMKLTKILTLGDKGAIEEMYRRMCFNVFAHNRDDHAKNFSFLYDEEKDSWRLSPAYDLTYSNTYFGEHTTSVNGNGIDPGIKELVSVGIQAGLKKRWCEETAEFVKEVVKDQLGQYIS